MASRLLFSSRTEVFQGKRSAVRGVVACGLPPQGVAPFHKRWGRYRSNPLVVEQGSEHPGEHMRISPKGLVGSGLGDSAIVTIDRKTDQTAF
jgi:hypothetical protein